MRREQPPRTIHLSGSVKKRPTPIDPIVERAFEAVDASGAQIELRLKVGRPEPNHDGEEWRCRFVIEGLVQPGEFVAYGIDGLQSLFLALQMAQAYLRAARARGITRVTWLGQEDLCLLAAGPARSISTEAE